MNYAEFLDRKRMEMPSCGLNEDNIPLLNPHMKDWQQAVTRWQLRKGRAAAFLDTGMGKTLIQLEYGRCVWEQDHDSKILLLAPLAVGRQTEREARKFDIAAPVRVCKNGEDIAPGINITNYERMHHFNPDEFACVIPDESSIMKNFTGKIRNQMIDDYQQVPYKLPCTATPAPNDFMELGNHAEFLGAMSRTEMLSMFFVHDGGETQKWRLKGHAQDEFWRWMASWSIMLSNPADIGYDGTEYQLPPIHFYQHMVDVDHSKATGDSFLRLEALTLRERQQERKATVEQRCRKAAEIANSNNEPFLAWCDLNDESALLAKQINGAVEVKGSDSAEHKERAMLGFSDGSVRCLVTKPSIAGFGMNWQHCGDMAFVGLSDSYEKFKQAVARCHRFGRKGDVNAHIIVAETEGAVLSNIRRKEADAIRMRNAMVRHMSDLTADEIRGTARTATHYAPSERMTIPLWVLAK